MRREIELGREAALTVHAAPERKALERAFEVEGPLMVRAGERLGIARRFLTKLDALVRAAVHEHVDATLRVTRDDDRRLPHEAFDEVAAVRDFRFEPDVIPRRTAKEPSKALGLPAWANIFPLPKHGAASIADYVENDSDAAAFMVCQMGQTCLLFGTSAVSPR